MISKIICFFFEIGSQRLKALNHVLISRDRRYLGPGLAPGGAQHLCQSHDTKEFYNRKGFSIYRNKLESKEGELEHLDSKAERSLGLRL